MLRRTLAMGLGLALAATITGCKCCHSGNSCNSSPAFFGPVGQPAPCNSCGTPGGPAVVVPPPAPVAPAPVPGAGPYGASFERRV